MAIPPDGCKVIHIGVDPLFSRLPIRSFPCDVAVTGPARVVLPQIAAALGDRIAQPALAARRARKVRRSASARTKGSRPTSRGCEP